MLVKIMKFLTSLLLIVVVAPWHSVFAANLGDAILVTNRGSGDLSVIDTQSLVEQRVSLDTEGKAAEPMYVNHWRGGKYAEGNRIFVGDRANDRVLVLDDRSLEVIQTIPVGKGVFHQWIQPKGHQLWVVSDVDKTLSVINPLTLEEIERINIPASLAEQGAKPHDVFVTRWYAYVTVVGLADGNSKVLRYNTWDFKLSATADVGGDAHVFVKKGRLYIPSQDDSKLRIFNAHTMKLLNTLDIPNAHGITSNGKTNQVYLTNIAGGGIDGVWSIKQNGKKVIGSGDTLFATPHNVALDAKAEQLFVTHSGANNTVSVLKTRKKRGTVAIEAITVGENPFGIGLAKGILSK